MNEDNKNMNPESIKSIKEFHEKQVKTNIKIHIFFLTMIIFINICLIIFIISYKYKISQISSKNKKNTSNITKKKDYLSTVESSLSSKMVNIFAMSFNSYGNVHFSFLFDNSDEVQSLKNRISSSALLTNPYMHLIYESNIDGDKTSVIMNIIRYWTNLLFITGTKSGEKFGFFFQESVYPDKYGIFKSNTKRCFLYSFKNKIEYPCNDIFTLNYKNFLNIGNGDIIINHDFKQNGGVINYPFKSFKISESENEFEKLNGNFEIKDIEIFLLFDLNQL